MTLHNKCFKGADIFQIRPERYDWLWPPTPFVPTNDSQVCEVFPPPATHVCVVLVSLRVCVCVKDLKGYQAWFSLTGAPHIM